MEVLDLDNKQFPVTVEFENSGTVITFLDDDEFSDFLDKERSEWANIYNKSPGQIQNRISNNTRIIEKITKQGVFSDEGGINEQLKQYFPVTVGPGRIIAKILDQDPDLGHSVISSLFGSAHAPSQIAQTANALQWMIRVGHLLGVNGKAIEAEAKIHEIIERTQNFHSQFKGEMEEVLTTLRTTKERYVVDAALNAPKTYWEARAEVQRRRAQWARWRWQGGTALLLGVIAYAATHSVMLIPADSGATSTDIWSVLPYLQRVILVAAGAAIAIWWLKQQLKDLRIHEHLAEDAAERATMIDTFSALQGAGLGATELNTVLTAIYRPAAAAVSDDAGPMLPIEVMLKSLGDLKGGGK